MTAFQLRMPAGIPGVVTRLEQSTIEAQLYDPTAPFPAYAWPMKTVNGRMQPIGAGDPVEAFAGLLVRPYPTGGPSMAFGFGAPPTTGFCNRLRRGYMMVQLNGNAPAVKDGQVFIRVGGVGAIGGLEAAADATPGNTLAPANFVFTGPADSTGQVEVAWNI